MLLRHSANYLVARGLPGIANFAALAIYTRLLAPDDFGRYALVLAGVGLVYVFIFQWQSLVLARFLSASREQSQDFLAGILAQFLVLSLFVSAIGLALALAWPDPVWRRLMVLALALLLVQAAFELTLCLANARLQPGWYGKLLGSKAAIGLAVGALLAWIGLGAAAPMIGLTVAHVAALMLFGWAGWHGVKPRWPDKPVLRAQLAYGLPLIVTFALVWVVSASDRLLLVWFLDEGAVGVYAAGYDLAFQSLTLLVMIIHTAAYPLVVTALEHHGEKRATQQLQSNGELIISATLSGAVGLIVMAPPLVHLVIGEAYRAEALYILPWVAVASALAGLKAFHFDIAFHLGRNSRWLVVIGAVAALLNVMLNLILIPAHGIIGAAWGTLGAFGIALLLSMAFGSREFSMPSAAPLLFKGSIVAAVVGISAGLGVHLAETNIYQLSAGLVLGTSGAIVAGLSLDIGGVRQAVRRRLVSGRS